MKLFQTLGAVIIAILLLTTSSKAQAPNAKALVETQNFIFKAQTALPATGSIRQLTPGYYTLNVSKDSLVADLPYFGRVYIVPENPSEGGIKFSSTSYSYSIKDKRNAWDINISPKSASDISQLYLTVYNNGTAYLQVLSASRQAISFNGVIETRQMPSH